MKIQVEKDATVSLLLGHIETPASLQRKRAQVVQEASVMQGYALGAYISNELADAIEESRCQSLLRMTIFTTPRGIAFLAITIQVDERQLRFVACLSEPEVQAFLRWSVLHELCQFAFEICETGQLMRVAAPFNGADKVVLERLMSQSGAVKVAERSEVLASAVAQLARPHYIPSLLREATVRDVYVVSVMPDDVLAHPVPNQPVH